MYHAIQGLPFPVGPRASEYVFVGGFMPHTSAVYTSLPTKPKDYLTCALANCRVDLILTTWGSGPRKPPRTKTGRTIHLVHLHALANDRIPCGPDANGLTGSLVDHTAFACSSTYLSRPATSRVGSEPETLYQRRVSKMASLHTAAQANTPRFFAPTTSTFESPDSYVFVQLIFARLSPLWSAINALASKACG
jgi:hypothetical protein